MTSISTCLLVVAALLALPARASADTAKEDEEFVRVVMSSMEHFFGLSPETALDPEIRAQASAMSRAHLARLPSIIKRWIAEERLTEPASQGELQQQVSGRLINHIALWRLQSAGRAHDEASVALLEQPRLCQDDMPMTYFASLAAMWQLAPPAHRQALLDGERSLLERWEHVPAALPDRPILGTPAAIAAAVRRSAEGADPRRVPMPPVVAAQVFDTSLERAGQSCSARQWWFREQRAGGAQEAALLALRYASMPTALEWLDPSNTQAADKAGQYPRMAARWNVTGLVVVEVAVDPSGKREARIFERRITAPGVRDVRPVAFETMLDEASLERAAAAVLKPGVQRARLEFNWRLE